MEWQLQAAKNQLSKLVQDARTNGPQTITLRGKRAAVVLSASDYDALRSDKPSFVDHLLSGPEWDDEMIAAVNARDNTPGRDIDF